MKTKKKFYYFLTMFMVLILEYQPSFAKWDEFRQSYDGCTIGVAAGKATSDGRPLLWKIRDNSSNINNEVYFNTLNKYKFISVIDAGKTSNSWMGVNERGFAILNSYSGDLEWGNSGLFNGDLMTLALGTCVTVADFEALLDSTNVTGRRTQANFGVIDSTGAAKIIETSGNQYWKFDANDTIQAPNGYVLRTNFSINGGGSDGIDRFNRAVKLIGDFSAGDSLNYRSILRYHMRDFSFLDSNPLPVPYSNQMFPEVPFGYICTTESICGALSVSASVIQGVLPGELAKLSTMWTILGQPALSIAVPFWPVGDIPAAANGSSTAPLCDVALQIKSILFDFFYVSQYEEEFDFIDTYKLRNEYGNGLWAQTFAVEDSIFIAADNLLDKWRTEQLIIDEMVATENVFASYALSITQQAYKNLVTIVVSNNAEKIPTEFSLSQNYPNPFNPSTTIRYSIPEKGSVTLSVYDITGQKVTTLVDKSMSAGSHSVIFDGADFGSGVYLYKFESIGFTKTGKMLLLK